VPIQTSLQIYEDKKQRTQPSANIHTLSGITTNSWTTPYLCQRVFSLD